MRRHGLQLPDAVLSNQVSRDRRGSETMFLGSVIVIVGTALLLTQTGVLSGSGWDLVLPASVIALGVSLISDGLKDRRRWNQRPRPGDDRD